MEEFLQAAVAGTSSAALGRLLVFLEALGFILHTRTTQNMAQHPPPQGPANANDALHV